MIKIENNERKNRYIQQFNMRTFLSDSILPYVELVKFKKGEHICMVDMKLDYLFFYVEGKANVYTTMGNGKSLLLYFYTPMKVLGEVEFLHQSVAKTNVQCMEDSYCLAICVKDARDVMLSDPQFLRYISEELGRKLEYVSINSSINLVYPLENRLASYMIASLSNAKEKRYFQDNLTHVADLLGTSYRHLLRTLKNLCEAGILSKRNALYEIQEWHRLEELALDVMQK